MHLWFWAYTYWHAWRSADAPLGGDAKCIHEILEKHLQSRIGMVLPVALANSKLTVDRVLQSLEFGACHLFPWNKVLGLDVEQAEGQFILSSDNWQLSKIRDMLACAGVRGDKMSDWSSYQLG